MPRKIEKLVYTFKELVAAAADPESPVTERAVDRARDWLREVQTDHDWWDSTYETWQDALDQIGFTDADISFSGFWSQGDGASFKANVDLDRLLDFMSTPIPASESIDYVPGQPVHGHDEDFRGWLVKQTGFVADPKYRKLLRVRDAIDATVKRTSHQYSHENTCQFEAEFRDTGEWHSADDKHPHGHWESHQPRLRALFEEWEKHAEELRRDLCHAVYKALEEEYEYLTGDEALTEMAEANEYTFDEDGDREG